VHTKRRHDVPVLLNYLTAPDVVIWSAASASCAIPGIYAAATLLVKDSKGAIVPWNPSAVRLSAAKVGDEIPVSRLSELFNVNNFIVSHVPSYFSWKFAAHSDSTTRAWLSRLWNWLCRELRHRLYQLKRIGLIPSSLQRLGDMVSTPGVGDVRIEPTIWTSDILYILANPSPRFVAYCLHKGQQAAWRHLSQINVRCTIEFEIEKAIQQVRSLGRKSRLPLYK
jgi:TAG lipase/lysophosphatidylethanolamine acyltransferase